MTTEANSTGEGESTEATGVVDATASEGTSTETAAAGAESTGVGDGAVRPEGLDEKFWDPTTGLKVGDLVEHLRDLEAKSAAREDVPGETESYDLKLPEGLEVPQGLEIEFKADDPLWADFQQIAREEDVTRKGFGRFVGAFAKYQLAQQQADIDSYVEQKAALGANADARIKAGTDWLKANLKAEHAEALADLTVSKAGVEAIEALIKMKSGPLAASGVGTVKQEPTVEDRWFPGMKPKAA